MLVVALFPKQEFTLINEPFGDIFGVRPREPRCLDDSRFVEFSTSLLVVSMPSGEWTRDNCSVFLL